MAGNQPKLNPLALVIAFAVMGFLGWFVIDRYFYADPSASARDPTAMQKPLRLD